MIIVAPCSRLASMTAKPRPEVAPNMRTRDALNLSMNLLEDMVMVWTEAGSYSCTVPGEVELWDKDNLIIVNLDFKWQSAILIIEDLLRVAARKS